MKPYAALALLALTLGGCGAAESNPQATPAPEASTPAPSEPAAEQAKQSEGPAYFGAWTVQGAVASAGISTAPDDGFAGQRATYSAEEATFGEERIQTPEYAEKELSETEFLSEHRTPPSDLGLEGGTVRIVEVSGWTNPGGTFIAKDENTLLFLWDGNYYEMKRDA